MTHSCSTRKRYHRNLWPPSTVNGTQQKQTQHKQNNNKPSQLKKQLKTNKKTQNNNKHKQQPLRNITNAKQQQTQTTTTTKHNQRKTTTNTTTIIQSGEAPFLNRRGASTPLWGVEACSLPSRRPKPIPAVKTPHLHGAPTTEETVKL